MSIFEKGVVLEQNKEPMLSESTYVMKHESVYFDYPFGDKTVDDLSKDEIIKIAELANIIDENTGNKLCDEMKNAPEGASVIIDAINDEPYISSQMAHLLHDREELSLGAALFSKGVSAGKTEIYVYENIFDLITPCPSKIGDIHVKRLGGRYPAESRAYAKLRRKKENMIVGSDAIIHLARAFRDHLVQTTAFVTVAGDILERPRNMEVPIGATAGNLLDMCKVITDPELVIIGGPMSGRSTYDPYEEKIEPSTSGVLAFKKSFKTYSYRCIGCGKCDNVCPKNLTPSSILKISQFEKYSFAENYDADKCIECGACNYACPARLNVMGYVIKTKKALAKRKEEMG